MNSALKILVIEDDPTLLVLTQKLLQVANFEVITSQDGPTGVQLAQSQRPDLILCDIMMPKFDGYQVLQQLKQDAATQSIPFIFLTAKTEWAEFRRGMNLGADDYLTKPFTREELLKAIATRLDKQSALTQPYLTEMKRTSNQLIGVAYHDPTTNLPNRIHFYRQLEKLLEQAERQAQKFALLTLRLKPMLNNPKALAQLSTNGLPQQVAQRLYEGLSRDCDISCLNTNEFGIILGNLSAAAQATKIAQTIVSLIARPYEFEGVVVQVQPSLGVAVYPEHGTSAYALIRRAELAMHEVSGQEGGGYLVCPFDDDVLEAQRELSDDQIKTGLERDEFYLVYQPQVNLITGRVVGVEAFLRWQHPKFGVLYPNEFLPIAEATDSIFSLERWVLQTVCRQAKTWQSLNCPSVQMSINLSPRCLHEREFMGAIARILQTTGANASLIALDLSESMLLEYEHSDFQVLQSLKELGFRLYIDDFGCGFSSIAHLKRAPLDGLKIDRSFLKEFTIDSSNAALIRAIIALGQNLQLRVIAEGVETHEQFNLLKQMGCYAGLGHHFSAPISAETFQKMLESDRRF